MLVHGDMDDERTLDEEEQQEIQEEVKAEVDNLQEVCVCLYVCVCVCMQSNWM